MNLVSKKIKYILFIVCFALCEAETRPSYNSDTKKEISFWQLVTEKIKGLYKEKQQASCHHKISKESTPCPAYYPPEYCDHGTIGLSEATIDAPPPSQRAYKHSTPNAEESEKGKDLLHNIKRCLSQKSHPPLLGGNVAIGLCQQEHKEIIVLERFGYGSYMKKTKSTLELSVNLHQQCQAKHGALSALYVPL